MAKRKITLATVKTLKLEEVIWDTELKGFGCRHRANGRYFILKYFLRGRQRIYTIGRWGDGMTPDQARDQAEILRGRIREGLDPMAEKEREKAIPIMDKAFKKYLAEIKTKRSINTHNEYERIYNKSIKDRLGSYQLDSISRADIARIHNDLADTPYQANRLLAVLSSFFSWSIKHGHRTIEANPCRYIERYKEKGRERFLSEEEIFKLGEALTRYEEDHRWIKPMKHRKKEAAPEENAVTPYVTAAIRLLMLTGARVNEILSLKWKDVDFARKLIRLQESKTGQKTIYLSAPALQVLNAIPRIEGNEYVICGQRAGAHLVNIKDPWGEIRKNAGLEDVRLHDLRHNFASTAVTAGHHLKVIGALLGHANTKTTERYAHLANDPLQTANEQVSQRILNAMTKKPETGNVVKLSKNS
ncbi:MAG: DUF4102 domain-containing protein [Verrucomicrobiae bacterium]|nr:DUF4102 domain-containing protein [Verrucomicrobiae bacterium]